MSLELEYRAKRAREILSETVVVEAMKIRCDEQGHDYEGGIQADFGLFTGRLIHYRCKWCGEER